jgi:hypothetical protein
MALGSVVKLSAGVFITSLLLGSLWIAWFMRSAIEIAIDPVTKFIFENDAYKMREIPAEIIPIGLTKNEFETHKRMKRFSPVEDSQAARDIRVYSRTVMNTWQDCEMDFRVFAKFDEQSRLIELNGFTPTYTCTIEP